jgi:RNA polymerase sigma factor (sigma-70 family)
MALEKDLHLVADVLAARAGALEAFVAHHRAFVYAILTRHLSFSPNEADEIFQRFMIHIWEDDYRRLRSWSGRGSLRAYVGTMVRNLGHDYRRESSADACLREGISACMPAAIDERLEVLRFALLKLSKRERDLLSRRYDLEQSYREIADALGMTISHVGVALHRAEKRLRKLLSTEL